MQKICNPSPAAADSQPPIRTLLVDDSTVIMICLSEYLDMQALVRLVGTATNGSEAVRKAEALQPDLVLMDLQMPCMDGLQATTLLRQRLPNTRIIIMTLDETEATKAIAHAHGAHGFVGKSRLAEQLLPEIRRVFQQQPVAQ